MGVTLALDEEFAKIPGYRYTFDWVSPRAWGLIFVAVGVLTFGGLMAPKWERHPHVQARLAAGCAAAQAVLMLLWAVLLFVAAVDPGLQVTFLGPIMWGTLAVADFASLWRFGTGR